MLRFKVLPQEKVLLRIVPHHTVLNSMNRKLWHTFHTLLSMYNSPWSRLEREGLHFTFHEKHDIWWIATLRAGEVDDDGEPNRQIEFFVCLPFTFVDTFIIKMQNHEQWRRCTIEEADFEDIQFSLKDMDAYQMRYRHSNMFSLSHDYARQLSPVREIMHVSQELMPNDFAGMFVRLETVERRRWKKLMDYAWETWRLGKVPSKNGINFSGVSRSIRSVVVFIVAELKMVIDSTLAAIENSFYATRAENPERTRLELVDPEREALEIDGGLSPQTRGKRNLPAFSTHINIIVNAPTRERRDMLANSMASAFVETDGDNKLDLVKVNFTYGKEVLQLKAPKSNILANQMSTDEVGKIVQLPTADVQREFADELESNQNTEVELPKAFLDPSGIYMGTSEYRGEKFDIHLPTKNMDMLMTPRAFLGSPRMGKDQAVVNMVVEGKLKHGIGAVILDVIDERRGHRGMGDAIRDHLPAEDIIDIDTSNFDYAVQFDMQGILKRIGNQRIAVGRMASEIVSFVMGEDMENYRTREYLRSAAKITFGDLYQIQQLFIDSKFRKETLERCAAEGVDVKLLVDFDSSPAGTQKQIAAPIYVRLNELLNDEFLKPIFSQKPSNKFGLEKFISEGKIVIVRIATAKVGESAMKTLMHWLILQVFMIKSLLDGEGAPTWLILNEPHQFLSPGLIHFCKRILTEGAKKKLAPVFLFHHFRQLPTDFVDILFSSSLNWHILKNTNNNVYTRLRTYIEPTFTTDIAMENTKRFHYIAAWLDGSGEYQTPFMMKALDLVGRRYKTVDNSNLTKFHIQQYGTRVKDILAQRK